MPSNDATPEALRPENQRLCFGDAVDNLQAIHAHPSSAFIIAPEWIGDPDNIQLLTPGEAISQLQFIQPNHPLLAEAGNSQRYSLFEPITSQIIVKSLTQGMEPLFNDLSLHFEYVTAYALGQQLMARTLCDQAAFALAYAEYHLFLEYFRRCNPEDHYSSFAALAPPAEYRDLLTQATAFADEHRLHELVPKYKRELIHRLVETYGTFEALLFQISTQRFI